MMRLFGVLCILLLAMASAFAQEESGEPPESAAADPAGSATDTAPADTAAPDPEAAAAETPEAPEDGAAATETPPAESGDADAPAAPTGDDRFVVICPIESEIDEAMAVVVERAVESAKDADALLFVINTPGGRVDSAIEITTAIMTVECPTIAYIEGMGAISAGALISYACDYIYMAAGSNIGASTPIMPGVETTEAMDEKSNSFVRGKYRALGEANGHDPLLGEAMVDRDMEVRAYPNDDGTFTIFEVDPGKSGDGGSSEERDLLEKILEEVSKGEGDEDIGDLLREILGAGDDERPDLPPVSGSDEAVYEQFLDRNTELVSARGELLTMTSDEATYFGLAEKITTDVDDTLREFLLGSVDRVTITPTWDEALFGFLTSPTIAGLLLMVGLGGLYVEARTPGFGAPGIIGASCLALFFGAHMVIGMADWVDVLLIVCGFLLILAEIFLLPGFGIAGILGIVCLVAGSYLALVKAPIPEFTWEVQQMQDALYTLSVTMVSLILFIVTSGLLIPYSPLANVLVLKETQEVAAGYTVQRAEEAQSAIGLQGVATSPLRPAGRGRFGGKTYDVVTRGEFVDRDTAIRIIESSGNRYVVAEVKGEETA